MAANNNQDDERRTCAECYMAWIFTRREKQFMQSKNYTAPTRCPTCRQRRRHARTRDSGDVIARVFE